MNILSYMQCWLNLVSFATSFQYIKEIKYVLLWRNNVFNLFGLNWSSEKTKKTVAIDSNFKNKVFLFLSNWQKDSKTNCAVETQGHKKSNQGDPPKPISRLVYTVSTVNPSDISLQNMCRRLNLIRFISKARLHVPVLRAATIHQ